MKRQDAGLRLRVERGLREAFVDACRADGTPAAQVLRTFMRQYIQKKSAERDFVPQHATGSQQERTEQ